MPAEIRLRLHVGPWFADRPIERIGPADVRRWQTQLAGNTGRDTVLACRSLLLLRIFQFAMDEGAIDANPVRKVPPPKRRADPEQAGLRCRVHLDRPVPVLQVVEVRYQAGRKYGSGFKPHR